MKTNKMRLFVYLIFIFSLLQPARILPEEKNTDSLADLFEDINELVIKSNSWKGDLKNSSVSFIGDVKVTADNMKMNCRRLTLFFKTPQKDTSSNNKQPPVDKFHATGSIKIDIPEMGNAEAEDAVYERGTRQIILTGNPVGKFYMDGRKYEIPPGVEQIIYDLKEETILVESSKDEQAGLIISGKEEGN